MFKKEGRNLIENNAVKPYVPLISGESRPSDAEGGGGGAKAVIQTLR